MLVSEVGALAPRAPVRAHNDARLCFVHHNAHSLNIGLPALCEVPRDEKSRRKLKLRNRNVRTANAGSRGVKDAP